MNGMNGGEVRVKNTRKEIMSEFEHEDCSVEFVNVKES